ncbi:glycerol-3-phosphate 1-O-acyltransferase PlsY [Pelagibius sp.]|uniref:glycerol-3-phosphate 1-O-acyltransferase PlsY n=1 Tax=Pelagibius sp. TaxID=1931238 RepID=UPI002634D7AB|nr:glycerol-3-phosphate 1-O-acyltransferase PlsY [Pelagibius sp.]
MPDPISWGFAWPYLLAALIGGYILGSLPFGLLLTRAAGLGDVREIGSGNIGATNVLRTGRKGLAAATLLLDGGKGAAAVLIAANWGPDMALVAAFGAVVGHLFPVWLAFKGGKGVATTLGVLIALSPLLGALCCALWLLVAFVFRISSLAALVCIAAAPFLSWVLLGDLQMVELTGALALLVWWRHHANIARLLKGEEPRIGRKAG